LSQLGSTESLASGPVQKSPPSPRFARTAPAIISLVEEDYNMRAHINATAVANTNVDLSQHLDCFMGRGFEIRKSTHNSMSLRFPVGTSIGEMRDCFAAGLIALLIKLPDSGAAWALARPIRINGTEAPQRSGRPKRRRRGLLLAA
jgi:hypothetical protein